MITKTEKPWGYELLWAETEHYVGKILHINKGEKLSLQYHKIKDETIMVISGEMRFEVEENGKMVLLILKPYEPYHIKPMTKHRMEAIIDCDVFEVSTPHLTDVVRLEDKYGRADRIE